MIVKDPDGRIVSDTGEKPSKSFLIAFLIFLGALFDGVDTSAKELDAGMGPIYVSGSYPIYQTAVKAPINVSTYGIQIGTGDTAEDNEDYKLDTQLTEGVGAGNITHGAVVLDTVAVVGANVDMDINRAFTNATGSAIVVKEAGIVLMNQPYPGQYFHLIIRDVLPASVEVPDKCSLAVIYTVRTTV